MRRTTFAILCLEGATLSFNVAATAALVPSIASEFGLSQFLVGRIVWLYMLPYGIAALIYGPLVKFFDARRVELVCFFLFCLANLFAGLAKNIHSLFLARFLMGVFGASVIPLVLILIARLSDEKNRGKLVGIFFSFTFVASLAGLLLSGILPWRQVFFIPAVFGFIVWIHIYFYLPSFGKEQAGLKINYLSALRDKSVIRVFAYIFLVSLIYHGIQQWLGVYFSQKFQFSQFNISMLITLTSFSGIFGEVLGGYLSDILGRVRTVEAGLMLMVLSVFLLLGKFSFLTLAVLMIVWGLGWTLNHAGLSTMLTDLPRQFVNEAASLNSSLRFLSGGLGAFLGGMLMQRSLNLSFLVFGTGLLILFFAQALLTRRA